MDHFSTLSSDRIRSGKLGVCGCSFLGLGDFIDRTSSDCSALSGSYSEMRLHTRGFFFTRGAEGSPCVSKKYLRGIPVEKTDVSPCIERHFSRDARHDPPSGSSRPSQRLVTTLPAARHDPPSAARHDPPSGEGPITPPPKLAAATQSTRSRNPNQGLSYLKVLGLVTQSGRIRNS